MPSSKRNSRTWQLCPAAVLALLLTPRPSQAHIKWFCAYDTTVPPLPIADVVTPTFLAICIGFCVLMFGAYAIHRVIDRTRRAARIDDGIRRCEPSITTILRSATGILFLAL